jgi:cobaltochelatase CobT
VTIVDAEQLGGAMTDKLAELFGEEEAKKAKAAASAPEGERRSTRMPSVGVGRAVKKTTFGEVAKGRRSGS